MIMEVENGVAYFDDKYKDLIINGKWHIDGKGYCVMKSGRRILKLHEIIWKAMGKKGKITFKNTNRSDCRSENLIKLKEGSNKAIRELGINYDAKISKYIVRIWDGEKLQNYGEYTTLGEALDRRTQVLLEKGE